MPQTSKPWGWEELLECNESYMVKKLFMKQGHRCSLQYHKQKTETIVVLEGILQIQMGQQNPIYYDLKAGDRLTVNCGQIHRMEAASGDCTYIECSTPDILGRDITRISDDYGR